MKIGPRRNYGVARQLPPTKFSYIYTPEIIFIKCYKDEYVLCVCVSVCVCIGMFVAKNMESFPFYNSLANTKQMPTDKNEI